MDPRVVRIILLCGALYSAGYTNGMHDYIRDVEGFYLKFIL